MTPLCPFPLCFSKGADKSALCPARRVAPSESGDMSPHSKIAGEALLSFSLFLPKSGLRGNIKGNG
jgi:hypothetical protein